MDDHIHIDHGFAVRRKWDGTYLTMYGQARLFDQIKSAKLAVHQDKKHENQQYRDGEYGDDGNFHWTGQYKYRSGIDRVVGPNDYQICRVQIFTQPVEDIEWNYSGT